MTQAPARPYLEGFSFCLPERRCRSGFWTLWSKSKIENKTFHRSLWRPSGYPRKPDPTSLHWGAQGYLKHFCTIGLHVLLEPREVVWAHFMEDNHSGWNNFLSIPQSMVEPGHNPGIAWLRSSVSEGENTRIIWKHDSCQVSSILNSSYSPTTLMLLNSSQTRSIFYDENGQCSHFYLCHTSTVPH